MLVTAPGSAPAFTDPTPVGGTRPRIADLDGRLVAITPLTIETVPNTLSPVPGATQRRITADIVVLDGGPLDFGGNPAKGIPHALRVAVPYEATAVFISQQNLVVALERSIGSGIVLGRVKRGQANNAAHNPPWNLIKLDDASPADVAARQQAITFWSARQLGGWANPVAMPIAAFISASPAHAAMAHEAVRSAYNAQPAAPVAPAAIPPAPTGWDPTMWANMPAEQRAAILAVAAPVVAAAPTGY